MPHSLSTLDYADPAPFRALVTQVLEEACKQGANSAAVVVGANSGLSASVRLGEVETIEHHRSKQLGVTVYFDHRTGSATTTDLDQTAVSDTVAAACRIARYTQHDEYAGLAEPDRMATDMLSLDLHHPWQLEADDATQIALEIEASARACDSRITNSDGASVSRFEGCHVYANTHGFVGEYAGTRHSTSCAVIAENTGEMQRDAWYSVARNAADLEAPADVGTRAGERTISRLGAKRLSTRTVPVIFSADTAKRLFTNFLAAIGGGNLYRKASFLVDSLGEQVFPETVDITDEPHLVGALGSSPFDYEGVATKPCPLVSQGVVGSYLLDSYSGRRLGMPSTGHAGGVHNLIIKPGTSTLQQLMATMGSGLLITELMGMGVNILTGDYSRGVAGYWVENGEIQYPVEEITAAGNLTDMFAGIQAIGNDVDMRSGIRTGSVLIDHMTIAGE